MMGGVVFSFGRSAAGFLLYNIAGLIWCYSLWKISPGALSLFRRVCFAGLLNKDIFPALDF